MKPLASLSALAALALLAGCAAQPPFGAFRAGLTQELVDTVDNPLLYVGVEGLGRESTVQPLQELDGVTTWRTPDGTSAISTRDGLVVSTRSLGDDLMAADIAGSVAASKGQGGGGYYPRFHTTLDGLSQPEFEAFQCRVSARTSEDIVILGRARASVRTDETCTTPGREVTNSYWRAADGTMLRARQWISEGVGVIITERLN
ncbi:YjbF family lipoprotein [Roseivivax sp. GX 12232]|uniref:YjbF family lipoprotein n=1 Tax=Roseivivax sp. GX 12232 TaxID=2900547 RepID=UPI001E29A887|nr:YjbF family lipoprotein [Roseivivax sp. GX 12232]MCE0505060.1 YjbF family lipoprotein [Roseivivax sp. GX 12232]